MTISQLIFVRSSSLLASFLFHLRFCRMNSDGVSMILNPDSSSKYRNFQTPCPFVSDANTSFPNNATDVSTKLKGSDERCESKRRRCLRR